jgi:hypothetical protein
MIRASKTVDEGPGGNDLPPVAAGVAIPCRRSGRWIALHIAYLV